MLAGSNEHYAWMAGEPRYNWTLREPEMETQPYLPLEEFEKFRTIGKFIHWLIGRKAIKAIHWDILNVLAEPENYADEWSRFCEREEQERG